MPDESPEVTITFDPNAAASRLRLAVQRARDLAAFGFVASARLVDSPPTVGEVYGQLGLAIPLDDDPSVPFAGTHLHRIGEGIAIKLADASPESLPDLRVAFDTRLLGMAFQECVRAVAEFLLAIRHLARSAAELVAGEVFGSVDEMQRWLDRHDAKFDRLTHNDKVSRLERDYGIAAPPELSASIGSVIVARNCIEHRGGVVSTVDVDTSQQMVVTWTRFRLVTPSGREIRIGDSTTESIGVEVAPASRTFQIGERIAFSQEEFAEICWTFSAYADAVADSTRGYFAKSGIIPA